MTFDKNKHLFLGGGGKYGTVCYLLVETLFTSKMKHVYKSEGKVKKLKKKAFHLSNLVQFVKNIIHQYSCPGKIMLQVGTNHLASSI